MFRTCLRPLTIPLPFPCSPLFPTVVVINVANAIGTLADDLNVRLSLRANGGVGSLVRLLRDDVDPAVQVRRGREGLSGQAVEGRRGPGSAGEGGRRGRWSTGIPLQQCR